MDARHTETGSLVVTRRDRERVDILLEDGRVISVEVHLLAHGADCRLRITAPRSVVIMRAELQGRG